LQAGEFGYLFSSTLYWDSYWVSFATFMLSWAPQNHYHFSKDVAFFLVLADHNFCFLDDSDFNFSGPNSSHVHSNSNGNSWIAFLQAFYIVLADHNFRYNTAKPVNQLSWTLVTQSATGSRPELKGALKLSLQLPVISQPISQQITFNKTWYVHYELLKPLMVKILKRYDNVRTRTTTSVKEKKNESHLDEWGWERQATEHIAYSFGVLFNDGKKIACLWNGFKIYRSWKIIPVIMTSFYENVCLSKRLTAVVAFALYFLGLATHYHESWSKYCNRSYAIIIVGNCVYFHISQSLSI